MILQPFEYRGYYNPTTTSLAYCKTRLDRKVGRGAAGRRRKGGALCLAPQQAGRPKTLGSPESSVDQTTVVDNILDKAASPTLPLTSRTADTSDRAEEPPRPPRLTRSGTVDRRYGPRSPEARAKQAAGWTPEVREKFSKVRRKATGAKEPRREASGGPPGRVDRRCGPRGPEVRARIAAGFTPEVREKMACAKLGKERPEWVKQKITQSLKERPLEVRARMARAKLGRKMSPETRAKKSASMKAVCAKKREERLAKLKASLGTSQAGAAPGAAPVAGRGRAGASRAKGAASSGSIDELAQEKAVVEMMALRRELNAWMQVFASVHGYQPVLSDTAKTHPEVHKRFMRYVALRELVRQGF